jgi:hypothetical protein
MQPSRPAVSIVTSGLILAATGLAALLSPATAAAGVALVIAGPLCVGVGVCLWRWAG